MKQIRKNSIKMVVALVMSMGFVACSKSKKSTRLKSPNSLRTRTGINAPGVTQHGTQGYAGKVINYDQSAFQWGVDSLVSSFLDMSEGAQEMGLVSGTPGQDNTGFYLAGKMILVSGPFNPNQYVSSAVSSNSVLSFRIIDNLVGQKSQSGEVFKSVDMNTFSLRNGNVSGNFVSLEFDYYSSNESNATVLGKVLLEGTFDASVFRGQLYFNNNQYWDGASPGAPGTNQYAVIGQIEVPTCSFFQCN